MFIELGLMDFQLEAQQLANSTLQTERDDACRLVSLAKQLYEEETARAVEALDALGKQISEHRCSTPSPQPIPSATCNCCDKSSVSGGDDGKEKEWNGGQAKSKPTPTPSRGGKPVMTLAERLRRKG